MKTQFLSKWKHRDIDSLLDGVARYTRFVLVSKYTLIGVAVLLALAVVVMPLINPDVGGIRIAFNSIQSGGSGASSHPKMINPRFEGVDKNNQPFTVEAETAVQQDAHTVALEHLKADLTLENASWLAMDADSGVVNMDTKNMKLTGNVKMFSADGYHFITDAVDVDMAAGVAIGNTPVKGEGPLGALSAHGFIISERGKNILFTGPVALKIYPGATKHE